MKFKCTLSFLALCGCFLWSFYGAAQVVKGKIVDALSQEPIGYATVQLSPNYGVITNQEGVFSLLQKDFSDATLVQISHIGYEDVKITIKELSQKQVIALNPSSTMLNEVVLGPTLTASQIIQKYVENSKTNHAFSSMRVRYFSRSKESFVPKKFEIDLKKVSFANKKELQKNIDDFEKKFNNKEISSFTEVLTDVYSSKQGMVTQNLKALKLVDADGLNMDNFQEKFFEHTFQKLESPYTYRIKTGIIGLEKDASMKNISQDAKATDTLKNGTSYYALGYGMINHREFIVKQDIYNFTLEGTRVINGMLCYHLTFSPDKNRAKYVGELYINTDDFGLVYYKYKLAPDKSEFSLNLKWVLGVKFDSFDDRLEVLLKKSPSGTYYPQLVKSNNSSYVYVDRSLTLTENNPNKSERKKMKFNFLVEMIASTDNEIVAVEMEAHDPEVKITPPPYILYDVKRKYDPNYWSGYTILEATEALKNFKGE
jgi:hypothetical protein